MFRTGNANRSGWPTVRVPRVLASEGALLKTPSSASALLCSCPYSRGKVGYPRPQGERLNGSTSVCPVWPDGFVFCPCFLLGSDCLCDPQTDSERTDTAADGETSATEVRLQTEQWGRFLARGLCGWLWVQGFSGSALGLEGNDDFRQKLKVFSFAFSFVCLCLPELVVLGLWLLSEWSEWSPYRVSGCEGMRQEGLITPTSSQMSGRLIWGFRSEKQLPNWQYLKDKRGPGEVEEEGDSSVLDRRLFIYATHDEGERFMDNWISLLAGCRYIFKPPMAI